ncbi:hypothetical protein D3C71_1593740 [compost metagenome]
MQIVINGISQRIALIGHCLAGAHHHLVSDPGIDGRFQVGRLVTHHIRMCHVDAELLLRQQQHTGCRLAAIAGCTMIRMMRAEIDTIEIHIPIGQ